MTSHEDDSVCLGDSGIIVEHYHRPGHGKHISYADIKGAELFPLRFGTGRYRLAGFSPGRPRHFLHRGRRRSSKSHGVSLDVGRWRRIADTPDDPNHVLELVCSRIGPGREDRGGGAIAP